MSTRPYVSPIPAMDLPNYANRIEGQAVVERLHLWPKPDGGVTRCNPRCCRECAREATWTEDQTHAL